MLPDLDSLALFVRAAELRSLTKAAEASHLGLAAASRRMALLEHRFKATLFERSSRGVELTPAGAALLPFQAARPLGTAIGLVVQPLADEWAERCMLICVKRDRPANVSLNKLVEHLTRDLP